MLRKLFCLFSLCICQVPLARADTIDLTNYLNHIVIVEKLNSETGQTEERFLTIFSADQNKNFALAKIDPHFNPELTLQELSCLPLQESTCTRIVDSNDPNYPGSKYIIQTALSKKGNDIILETKYIGLKTADSKVLAVDSSHFIYKIKKLSIANSEIYFNQPTETVRCANIHFFSDAVQQLAPAVILILSNFSDNKTDLIKNTPSYMGSGFFISDDGLLLTNYHVLKNSPECIKKTPCQFLFLQTMPDGSVKRFQTTTEVLIQDQRNDFALLKIALPKDANIKALTIESQSAGPELFTLGYPEDMHDIFGNINLTYSSGQLTNTNFGFLSSNLLVNHGASGSPLIDDKNRVVGIVTAIAGNPQITLSIPISILDDQFGISDYLTGKKQQTVSDTIDKLSQTTDIAQATMLLDQYMSLKTLLGLDRLQKLMITHPSLEIRQMILLRLQQNGSIIDTE